MINCLINNVLPFWLDNAQDREYGGIFTSLDRKGKIYGYEKSVWFQGRALYIYSLAYNTVKKDNRYLEAAKNIYGFLPLCGDETGRMSFIVTREGKNIQKRRYYFSETFAAIGCAEYYIATKDEEALKKAEIYFDIAYDLYTGKTESEPKYDINNAYYDALSPSMIMLSTAQTLRKIKKEKYDAVAKEMTKRIMRHLSPMGLLENTGRNGEFINTPTGRILNPGHSLEAAWFLMAEGIYQNDKKLKEAGKKIIDISMKAGLYNDGIIAFTDCMGYPAGALEWDMKLWWPQCEAIIANGLCYNIFREKQYLDNYNMIKEYFFEKFMDKEYGEFFGYLHYDNTPSTTLKGNIFKGPFHIPRMLILADRLEKGEAII